MSQSTILVLGAQGMFGRFTAGALQSAGYAVIRAGRRPESAADFRFVDLDRPETLTAALRDVDLVVSSIEDPQARVERHVLQHGGVLLTQATLPTATRRLLTADAAQGAAGTAILNCGLSGVGALVAKDLLLRYPNADAIEIAYVVSALASAGLGGARYAHRLLTGMPRPRSRVLEFTPPHGPRRCFDLSDNQEEWLSAAIRGHRSVYAYLAIAERGVSGLLMVLGRLGLLYNVPEAMLTTGARRHKTALALTREPIRARFAVHCKGKLLAACGLDAEGDYNSSVQSTALFSQAALGLVVNGGIPAGLHCVEDLFSLDALSSALEAQRIVVRSLPI